MKWLVEAVLKTIKDVLGKRPVVARLLRGAIWGAVGTAASRLFVLASMIFLARGLGTETFGEFSIIYSTIGIGGLIAGAGMGSTATRFVAQHAANDKTKTGRIVGLIVLVNLLTLLALVILTLACSGLIADKLLNAPHLADAIKLGMLSMVANALRGIQNGVLAGFEKFDVIAKLNLLEGVMMLSIVPSLALGMGLLGAVLAIGLVPFLVVSLSGRTTFRILADHDIKLSLKGWGEEAQILKSYSLPNFIANAIGMPVLWYCMTVLASEPNGYIQIGIYNAAYQWHGPIIFLPMVIMGTSIPVLVQEWESGNRTGFKRIAFYVFGMGGAIALLPAILGSIFAKPIMMTYGNGFSGGEMVLILLLLAAPFHAICKIGSAVMLARNNAWRLLSSNLVWALILIYSVVTNSFGTGAMNMAAAFLSAYVVQAVVMLYLTCRMDVA